MKTIRSRSPTLLAAVTCLGLTAPSPAAQDFVRVFPEAIHWTDVPNGHGAQLAVLFGNPDQPGRYVIRARFPPHVMDRPHWHSKQRYVTVLQGTWYTGTGPTFDVAKAIPLPPGGFMIHPANAAHWDGSATSETVIVEITGEGPASTTLVDPAQPMWLETNK
jgi:hypothetical protein